jgi:hypothetical protein
MEEPSGERTVPLAHYNVRLITGPREALSKVEGRLLDASITEVWQE